MALAPFMTPAEMLADLGAQAREFRLQCRMEQAELALRAGVSLRTISNLEQGRGSSLETVLRVLKALGVPEHGNYLFPPPPTIDPMQMLKRRQMPTRIRKPRKPSSGP